jgi:hypothetical protein
MEAGAQARVVETRWWELAGGAQGARVMPRRGGREQGIPQGTLAADNVHVKKEKQSKNRKRGAEECSGAAARGARRTGMIRQNIIGRRVSVGGRGLGLRRIFNGQDRTFALFDQPAGKHGGGILLQPLIEELADFLAQIGGVAEAGEFVGLQGIARGGEKKFPGSLGAELRHSGLLEDGVLRYRGDINTEVICKASIFRITGLWKVVEKKENAIGVCSGCAGDYEDPDRSAWEGDDEEEDAGTEEK